jgi:hypothetical protein
MTSGFSTNEFSTSRPLTNSCSRLLPALILVLLSLPLFLFAQSPSSERVYQRSESDVHKALQQLNSSIRGPLPVLDGFVDTDQAMDSYSRGYYQCSVQMTAANSGGTLVKVTAKITAWYAGPGATPGGYRVLPSNGRLEADFLDRLDGALGGSASAQIAQPAAAGATLADAVTSIAAPASAAPAPPPVAVPESQPRGVVIPPYEPANSTSSSSSSSSEDLLSPHGKLAEIEQRRSLRADIQSLEEIQRNQVHPTNLAVVKLAGTPVLSLPAPTAKTIFRADAGDEFEILDKQENWVHVRIAGQSRGWIITNELDLPGVAEPPKSTGDLNRSETPAFHISREETRPFSGEWEPLHGKTVRIIWVEPASGLARSSAREKRSFAKSVFSKADQELASANQSVAGVVIVFDSADGGQISATLSTLKQWRAGSLSEASFWKRCALDPSDFLQEPSKTTDGNL